VKTGIHVVGNSDSVTRVPYTLMRAMGIDTPAWGEKSNRTSKEIGEILT
jgi:hypothetical protein